MRGVALAALVALAQGCAVSHAIDDAGSGVDAFHTLAPDAFVPTADAFVPPPDAFVPPPDAFAPLPDATTPPSDAGLTRAGYFVVEQGDFGGSVEPPFFEAYFGALRPAELTSDLFLPGCAIVEQSGACRVIACTTGSSSDLAGTLTASAGALSLSTSTTMSTSGGPPTWDVYFVFGSGPQLAPGQIVDIAATGATVPAFAGQVSMPPPSGATLPATISRSADYVVTWAAASADRVWAGIDPAAGGTQYISCDAPATAGSITIPHTLIAHFGVGDSVVPYAANANVVFTSAGSYLVRLEAWSVTEPIPTTLQP